MVIFIKMPETHSRKNKEVSQAASSFQNMETSFSIPSETRVQSGKQIHHAQEESNAETPQRKSDLLVVHVVDLYINFMANSRR